MNSPTQDQRLKESQGFACLMEIADGRVWSAGAISQPLAAAIVDRIVALEKALVYTAFAMHKQPQHQLAEGVTLIDSATVRVHMRGVGTVEVCHDE